MKLSKKKKNKLKDLSSDIFLKSMKNLNSRTLEVSPDMWTEEETATWELWNELTYKLDETIIKIVEGEK